MCCLPNSVTCCHATPPMSIKYLGKIHSSICFLKSPLQTGHRVFPGTAFRLPSPCAYQHPLSMKYSTMRTGTSPAWRVTRHGVSYIPSFRRYTSALGILEVDPTDTRLVSECVAFEDQPPCGSCATLATSGSAPQSSLRDSCCSVVRLSS